MALFGASQEEIMETKAKDITYLSNSEAIKLKREKKLRTIAISSSTTGMDGAIYRGKSGTLYKITERCDALLAITP